MFQSYSEKLFRPDLKSQTTLQQEHTHTPEQLLHCVLCDGPEPTWFTENDLEVHRKQVHFDEIKQIMTENDDRFCKICMTLQEKQETLIQHIKTRHLFSSPYARRIEREVFICDHCNHMFFNKEVLEVHIIYLHMGTPELRKKRIFTCPKCRKTCNVKNLWYHLQYHEIPSISACDICLFHCPCVEDLMKHVKEHPMYYRCEICNYHTLKDHLFEAHLDRHREDNVNTEALAVLKRKLSQFVTKKEFNSTILKYNIHHLFKGLILPSVIHICVLCREICTTKGQMAEHIIRDHNKTPKPFEKPKFRCQCGAFFQSKVLLKHHVFKMKGPHREYTDELPILTDQELQQAESASQEQNVDTNLPPTNMEVDLPTQEDPTQVIEVVQEVTEDGDEERQEIVYIYTDANEDQLVTIDQNSEQIISF